MPPYRYTVWLTLTQLRCILKALRYAMPMFEKGPGTHLSAVHDLIERLGAAYLNGSDKMTDKIHRDLLPKL